MLFLPELEDRQALETAIDIFLSTQNAYSRQIMHDAAFWVLKQAGLRTYRVNSHKLIITREKRGLRFRSTIKVDTDTRECPGCGADIYEIGGRVKIVQCLEKAGGDAVTYGCSCGATFDKWEKVAGKGEA